MGLTGLPARQRAIFGSHRRGEPDTPMHPKLLMPDPLRAATTLRRHLTTPPETGAGSDGNQVLDQWACLLEPPGEACGEGQRTTVRSSAFIVDDQPQAPATHTLRGLHLCPELFVPNETRPLRRGQPDRADQLRLECSGHQCSLRPGMSTRLARMFTSGRHGAVATAGSGQRRPKLEPAENAAAPPRDEDVE